jgi:exopolysaccharide biosynthesis polyprenyl glycosylphosphotransferase
MADWGFGSLCPGICLPLGRALHRMIRRYATGLHALFIFADIVTTMSVAAALWALDPTRFRDLGLADPVLGLLLFVTAWIAVLWAHGAYRLRDRWSLQSDIRVVARALAVLAGGTFAFLFLVKLSDVSRMYLVLLYGLLFLATVADRAAIRWFFGRARRRGRNLRRVLVLGTGPVAIAFAGRLEAHTELGLAILGFLGEPSDALAPKWPYLGSVDKLPDVIHDGVVDEVAICLVTEDWGLIQSIAGLCETEGKIVRMPVPMPHLAIATGHVEDLDGTPVLSMVTGPTATIALASKRIMDIGFAALGLVLLSPLLGAVAVAISLSDRGPIFYRQERVGLHGRRFQVVKFRSMVTTADMMLESLQAHNEVNGHAFKMAADPRVTGVGRFLRRSSLDELPQLWNVVRGEMSLVGPRPPLPLEVAGYDQWHRRRLSMKPGITGLWQIEGRREPEFDRWVQKDLEYIDRWSTWLDIRIMLRTIPAMIRAEGR